MEDGRCCGAPDCHLGLLRVAPSGSWWKGVRLLGEAGPCRRHGLSVTPDGSLGIEDTPPPPQAPGGSHQHSGEALPPGAGGTGRMAFAPDWRAPDWRAPDFRQGFAPRWSQAEPHGAGRLRVAPFGSCMDVMVAWRPRLPSGVTESGSLRELHGWIGDMLWCPRLSSGVTESCSLRELVESGVRLFGEAGPCRRHGLSVTPDGSLGIEDTPPPP